MDESGAAAGAAVAAPVPVPVPAPAGPAHAGGASVAAAAAPGPKPPPPSVEQCKVLQRVIKLLETDEDAKKMLPLASMPPEVLQATLAKSAQSINVADVLSKLVPKLEPTVAAQLWDQFRRSSAGEAAAIGLNGAAAAALAAAAPAAPPPEPPPPNQAAPLAPGAPNPAHAKLRRQQFAANSAKCGACHETYHPSYSPLILCDFCPSAFHIYCLGLDWPDLPEGEWACPGCLPAFGAGVRGLAGLSGRQRLEAERMIAAERMRMQAIANREERERRRAEDKAAKEAAKAREREERERLKADAKKAARLKAQGLQPDDADLAAEEAAEVAHLTSILPQLRDAAEREAAGGGPRRGPMGLMGGMQAYHDHGEDSGDPDHLGLPPLPGGRRGMLGGGMAGLGGGYLGAPPSAGEQLREAADRLRRLQATAAGPPPLQHVITGERELHSLMDALSVSDFLSCFAGVCGAPRLDLEQVQRAAAWPLDGPELSEIYTSLVKYLLAQWSHIESGHVGARVRRWARCLDRSCAVGGYGPPSLALPASGCCSAQQQEHHGPNGSATWQELLRRYCLLSRSSVRVKGSELKAGQEYAAMSDDLVMVHAAVELGRQSVWLLPPEFHLRLLHALCNDVVNCYNMKAEISSRLDTSITIQIEKFHADAEERKREKEAARMRKEAALAARDKRSKELAVVMSGASTPAGDAGTPDPSQTGGGGGAYMTESSFTTAGGGGDDGDAASEQPPLKRARSGSAAADGSGGTLEGTPGPGGDGTRDGTPDLGGDGAPAGRVAAWKSGEDREVREAALSAELARYLIRQEPLGMDRHHQRYWHMQSEPSLIFVEAAEGDGLGLVTSKAELDALMASLNRRGAREGPLHQALQKRYSEFARCLRPPSRPLDVRSVPRNRHARRGWLRRAAAAMPSNTPLDAAGWPVKGGEQQQQQLQGGNPSRKRQRDQQELAAVVKHEQQEEQQQQQQQHANGARALVKQERRQCGGGSEGEGEEEPPPYEQLLATSEATAVAASLSELELLVSQLVGAGIYDLPFKEWRRRLRSRRTLEELCAALEELEEALSRVGDGRPPNAGEEHKAEFVREADIYEAEFVMPVSAAELLEQQEAAAAAAAAEKAERDKAEAEGGGGGEGGAGGGDDGDGDGRAAAPAQQDGGGRGSKSKKKGGGGSGGSKKGKGGGGSKKAGGGKKGGGGGAAGAGGGGGDGDDDDTNPEPHRGPFVTLFSGATRVRKRQPPGAKQEDGGGGSPGAAADGQQQQQQEGEDGEEGDQAKMVSPLEELDDSDVEAEKRYQEKRAAEKAGEPIPPPPVVLWRSAREWGVWVKDLRRARTAGALGGVAYAAAALVDRAHRLMSNLALSRVRTGVAAAVAEDREGAVRRKAELLLGPSPPEGAPGTAAAAAAAAAAAGGDEAAKAAGGTALTSTGRRIKAAAEPQRKMSARQRNKRGGGGGEWDGEWGEAYGEYGEAYGYGLDGGEWGAMTFEQQQLEWEPPPPPEGKWAVACLACGGGGEVACCEVPGCSVTMHMACAGQWEADAFYCPDHQLQPQQPWLHGVPPPPRFQVPPAPPVRPNVP